MKLSGKVGNEPMNKRLDFLGETDTDPDPDRDTDKASEHHASSLILAPFDGPYFCFIVAVSLSPTVSEILRFTDENEKR